MTGKIFEHICSIANFPSVFYIMCKMEGDFLCSDIGNEHYYINVVTQKFGHCRTDSKEQRIVSHDPLRPRHRVVKKRPMFESAEDAVNYLFMQITPAKENG